jgi:hypothetical protein
MLHPLVLPVVPELVAGLVHRPYLTSLSMMELLARRVIMELESGLEVYQSNIRATQVWGAL